MEILIPAIAFGTLYVLNKKKESTTESMTNQFSSELPNVDIPNRNYPSEYPVLSSELDQTSKLSKENIYKSNTGSYTDKFFNPQTYIDDTAKTNAGINYQSLTGQKVASEYFKHNNMVPYFGGNLRTNHNADHANESILDNYVGSGSQTISKTEIAPLFTPETNTHFAFGMPNNNDFYQSRVNPSKNMANVKPFQDEKVGPGLGLGFTTEGSGGFNSGMLARDKWLDKNVDELRVATKPKASGFNLYGHEGPANSFIKTRGDLGKQEKNRQETAFAINPDRYFTTGGVEKGPHQIGVPIAKNVARPETSVGYGGNASSTTHHADYVSGEYLPSHNVELGAVPFQHAIAANKGNPTDADYQRKATKAYMNNRSVVQDDYFGSVKGSIQEVIAPLMDILKPSRKENSIGTIRPYQNPKTAVNMNYVFNPNDKTKITLRETTEKSKNHLNINSHSLQNGGGYQNAKYQPIQNARMVNSDFFYAGNSSASDGTRQMRSYDAEYAQRNNDVKSSTLVGYTPSGNISTFNSNIQMRTSNLRDLQLENRRDGVPTLSTQTPDSALFGKSTISNTGNYSNIQLDRNNGDVLTQLNSNPYAISAFAH